MSSKTRTGTISSGLDESGLRLSHLFGHSLASKYNDFEDVVIVNNSTVDISVASMEGSIAPAAADYKTIEVGAEQPIKRLSSRDFWVRTSDDGGTHAIEFVGTPA